MWQSLTPEIICQVFECATKDIPLLTFEPHFFPWHLGHICSAWRDAFISFPKIWTYLVIDFEQNVTESLERIQLSLEMVRLSLDRSKGCPIRFMFIDYWGSDHPDHQLSLEILQTLVIHSTRWKHAHFEMDVANLLALIKVKDRLPILHSLCLLLCPDSGLASSAHLLDLFDNTPQLRHLSFNSYPLWKIDWSTLSTIHLVITKDTIAALTHTSSKLEELFIINSTLPDDITPLTFPSLKRLETRLEGFLEFWKTPALEELLIEDQVSPNDLVLNRIASRFIRKQGIPLNKIAIYSNCINVTTILLRYVPDTTRHVYLHSWRKDISSVLSSCPAARYLESVTYEHWSEYKYLWPMVKRAESWQEQSIVAGSKGIGPFENMQQFTIELMTLYMGDQDESFAYFVDRLKKPFEECGVKCSVRPRLRTVHWSFSGVSPHFYFNCY